MADTKHLKQRGNTWYLSVRVPSDLRDYYTSPHIVRSLKTQSLKEAQRLRHQALAELHKEFEQKRSGRVMDPVRLGLALRQRVEAVPEHFVITDDEGSVIDTERNCIADEALDEIQDLTRSGKHREAAIAFRVFTSQSPLLADMVEPWLSDVMTSSLTNQTEGQYRADVKRFIQWAQGKGHLLVEEITKRVAGLYVTEGFDGLAPKTINRHISSNSSMWRWMEKRGLTEGNPWAGQTVAMKGKKAVKSNKPDRRAFRTDEIVTLLKGIKPDPIGNLFRLGLYTGCRIDELASLTVADIEDAPDGLWIHIKDGKTANAKRRIPVHSLIVPVTQQLAIKALHNPGNPERWLFPTLTPGGPDQKRGWNVSKTFGRYRRKLGVDGPDTVFHSARKSFAEIMEGQGVPEPTVQLLMGHERDGMSYGVYSSGNLVDLRAAILKLEYGLEVEALI